MDLRYYVNSDGEIHLQKLISYLVPSGENLIKKWEHVPITCGESSEAVSIPLINNIGIFLFEENVQSLKSFNPSVEIDNKLQIHIISALQIKKISEESENKTLIHTQNKNFHIKTDIISVINLLTEALSKFIIVKIDSNYNIKEIIHGDKNKTKSKIKRKSREVSPEKRNKNKGKEND